MSLLRRRTSNDIWTTPPGGAVVRRSRRRLLAPIAFGLAVTLGLGGAVAYSSMKSSTSVSTEDVLAEFQATGEPSSDGVARSKKDAGGTKPRDRRGDRNRGGGRERAESRRSHAAGSGGGDRVAAGSGNRPTTRAAAEPDRERSRSRRPAAPTPPREGVYAWQVDGYEQAPGIKRDLPARSHRVINHEGSGAWVEHHIFSEEKEQWMNLTYEPDGVTATAVRNRVEMGPVEEDNTVVYNPPVYVARVPHELGRTWKGSWEGKTSGSYTGRTFDHTTIVIQGEEIEVWASEVVMRMRGELDGTATTKSWYSPKYSMVVKQYQIVDIESGPGSYRSEWTGQVLSVTPQT